jgi:hypothetical protein
MTYLLNALATEKTTRFYELSLSSSLSISSGDVIVFDTLRSSSSGGFSYNSTTGVLSLNSSYDYMLWASVDITRTVDTSSFTVAFFNEATNSQIAVSDGGFDVKWNHDAGGAGTGNTTLQAHYIPVGTQLTNVTLRAPSVAGEANTNFSMIIIESERS